MAAPPPALRALWKSSQGATSLCRGIRASSRPGPGLSSCKLTGHLHGLDPTLFFSHRRDPATRALGSRCRYPLKRFLPNYARIREEVGPDVTVVVAIKYVPGGNGRARRGGRRGGGRDRSQDLVAKHELCGRVSLALHRPPAVPQGEGRLAAVGSLTRTSTSAAKRLTIPALVEVNLGGEETKSGVPPAELGAFLGEARGLGLDVRGLMTMPPRGRSRGLSRPTSAPSGRWPTSRASSGSRWARHRTTGSPVQEGATARSSRLVLFDR